MLLSHIDCHVPLRLFASFWINETVPDSTTIDEVDKLAIAGLDAFGCSPWLVSLELDRDELQLGLLARLVDLFEACSRWLVVLVFELDDLAMVVFGWLDNLVLAILDGIYNI